MAYKMSAQRQQIVLHFISQDTLLDVAGGHIFTGNAQQQAFQSILKTIIACFAHLFLSCFVIIFFVLKFLLLVTINLKCSILPLKMRFSSFFAVIFFFFWSFILTSFCEALSDALKKNGVIICEYYYHTNYLPDG